MLLPYVTVAAKLKAAGAFRMVPGAGDDSELAGPVTVTVTGFDKAERSYSAELYLETAWMS